MAVTAFQRMGRVEVFLSSRKSADRKSTRLNSSHQIISYAVFCLKKKNRRLAESPFLAPLPVSTFHDSSSDILILTRNSHSCPIAHVTCALSHPPSHTTGSTVPC